MSTVIKVRDFTEFPGPRYRKDGPFSGEEFREAQLSPALKSALQQGGAVIVELDGVAGYGSSFTEEAFGGLLRSGFSYKQVKNHLQIVAKTNRFQHHRLRAEMYIDEQQRRMEQGFPTR